MGNLGFTLLYKAPVQGSSIIITWRGNSLLKQFKKTIKGIQHSTFIYIQFVNLEINFYLRKTKKHVLCK